MVNIGKFFFRLLAGGLGCWLLTGAAPAAEPESNPRDTLVYKDGDRVQGRLLRREGEILVFKADRFGELRVPASDAVVIAGEKPAGSATPAAETAKTETAKPGGEKAAAAKTEAAGTAAKSDDRAEAERVSLWEKFSPWALTAKVRNYFGPWHGRFALSTEAVSDTTDRNSIAGEMHLQRKWKEDQVQLNGRYDYSETGGLATTDVMRGDASWRHDFLQGRFAQYRPSLEWNRANVRNGVPTDYVLLQQEIGGGYAVLARPTRKVRVGASENLFDTWTKGPLAAHNSRVAESVFVETEFTLPWRMTMTQRAVWYNPLTGGRTAWENHVELNKKFTETLSVSVQHEIRRNNPDGSAQDYQRLKLLLGLDF